MNIPAAHEQALAAVIRKYAALGKDVQVRPWQALAADGTVGDAGLRKFPLVDIRAAPPAVDENQRTGRCQITVICATQDGDDPNHAIISAMFDAVQQTLDKLFAQWITRTPGAEYNTFVDAIADLLKDSGYTFSLGGLTFGDGLSPRNENGINMIGNTLIVHYGRSDF